MNVKTAVKGFAYTVVVIHSTIHVADFSYAVARRVKQLRQK